MTLKRTAAIHARRLSIPRSNSKLKPFSKKSMMQDPSPSLVYRYNAEMSLWNDDPISRSQQNILFQIPFNNSIIVNNILSDFFAGSSKNTNFMAARKRGEPSGSRQ